MAAPGYDGWRAAIVRQNNHTFWLLAGWQEAFYSTMAKRKSSRLRGKSPARAAESVAGQLRIIGGDLRGRTIHYSGDRRTRPMKQRVREAVFNLVGPAVVGKHALDLFAGTGALGLEALSRGAAGATFIERHAPSVRLIRENVDSLGLSDRAEVHFGDAFLWTRQYPAWSPPGSDLWLVLCSPPYDFYLARFEAMVGLLEELHGRAPQGSLFVVEADARFDFRSLDRLGGWDVRPYPPAVIGLHECIHSN
jgi:16S rRNA (guanine(966)-N(2))-methyltransferase RsmD